MAWHCPPTAAHRSLLLSSLSLMVYSKIKAHIPLTSGYLTSVIKILAVDPNRGTQLVCQGTARNMPTDIRGSDTKTPFLDECRACMVNLIINTACLAKQIHLSKPKDKVHTDVCFSMHTCIRFSDKPPSS